MAAKLISVTALLLLHSAAGALLDDCKADPSNATCANSADFYPDSAVTMDVNMLCTAMPQMPSCTIKLLCEADTIAASSGQCGNWNLLTGICSTEYGENMQGMGGCATYKEICVSGSVVDSCIDATKKGPAELITTAEAKDAAVEYCVANPDVEFDVAPIEMAATAGGSMDMGMRRAMTKVCEDCTSTRCTMSVTILAHACKGDMTPSYCQELKKTCDANQNLDYLCTYDSDSAAAPRLSRFVLVLSFLSALMSLAMGPRL